MSTSKVHSNPSEFKTEPDNENTENQSWKIWKKRRYVVALVASMGYFNVYCLRVNMSMAIVAMTQNRIVTFENGTERNIGPEFEWDSTVQSIVLSSFFYGYITTQVVGGYAASKIGGKVMLGNSVAAAAVLTLMVPWLSQIHVNFLIAIRILQGVFQGVAYPCMYAMYSKWAPPLERSRLTNIAFSGNLVGTIFTMPACAYLSEYFGWQSIFYFFGTLGLIWYFFWMTFIAESPDLDKRIDAAEAKYILESLKETTTTTEKSGPVPWKKILTSAPVWALTVASFADSWGFYTVLIHLPKYLKDSLNFDLSSSGFLSSLPYLSMFIVAQFAGVAADWLLVHQYMTATQVRKLFSCGAFLSQTIFLMAAAFWSDRVGTVFCLTMGSALGTFSMAGHSTNYLEVAPQFAGVIVGIGNSFGSASGILTPIVTGAIVKTPPTVLQWQIVFYIAAGIYVFGALVYGIFGTGHTQDWAIVDKSVTETELLNKESNTRK